MMHGQKNIKLCELYLPVFSHYSQ